MPDMFEAQRRTDEFRAALGSYGRKLDRTTELDELLDQAARHDWTPERIGLYIAGRLPREARTGLVILTLRQVAKAPEPTKPTDHQLAATQRRRGFRQPLPPCGACDGSPARWLDITPKDHIGQAQVVHCPTCWTAPPGYVSPAARRAAAAAGGAFLILLALLLAPAPAPAAAVTLSGETVYPWTVRTIYVADHAGPHWPIRREARRWSRHTPLRLKVVQRCPSWVGCIVIHSGNYGPHAGQGAWTVPWLSRGRLVHVDVTMNSYYPARPYIATCHELGHAAGIYTHLGIRSCLYWRNQAGVPARPGKFAKWLLRQANT